MGRGSHGYARRGVGVVTAITIRLPKCQRYVGECVMLVKCL